MKTNLIHMSAIAVFSLAGSLIAADQSPAPSSPPSSSPTDTRNPTNPSSAAAKDSTSTSSSAVVSANPFQGKITAVDKESKMVTIQDSNGNMRKLHIGETTKLNKGSTSSDSGTWDDLQIGMEIRGTQKMQGSMSHAETVTINGSTR
jgi:hypothetical protein